MKRFLVLFAIALLICGIGTIFVGMLRPFAPEAYVLPTPTHTPRTIIQVVVPATNTRPVPTAMPDATSDITRPVLVRQVQATPSPSTPDVAVTPTTSTTDAAATPSPSTPDAAVTQTATVVQQTLDAISSRARATWTPTAGPSPTPRALDATTNILLMGTDLRPNDPNWVPATDVMMVVFLDTTNHSASIMSFPRDLVVAIPGHGAFRINYVYQYGLKAHGPAGGADLVKRVFHDEFNIRIDHWALIDFNGLQKIIDTLGGVDVQVPCPLEDTIDAQHFVIPAGNVHMDYLTAKRYVQSRYSTSDTSRNFRQQRVLWAMAKKGLQLNALDKVPTLWEQLHDSVQTDMSLFDMVGLVPAAYQLDAQNHPERIHGRVLEYPAVYPFISKEGAWLYMPNYAELDDRLDHLFDAPPVAASKPDAAECPKPLPTAGEPSVRPSATGTVAPPTPAPSPTPAQ